MPVQTVDATPSALEVPYKQVVLQLRANLASPLQRKRLIFSPFKRPGSQFNTLEKCSVLKFLQAGLRECFDDPLRPPTLLAQKGCLRAAGSFLQIDDSRLSHSPRESKMSVKCPCFRMSAEALPQCRTETNCRTSQIAVRALVALEQRQLQAKCDSV